MEDRDAYLKVQKCSTPLFILSGFDESRIDPYLRIGTNRHVRYSVARNPSSSELHISVIPRRIAAVYRAHIVTLGIRFRANSHSNITSDIQILIEVFTKRHIGIHGFEIAIL